MTLSLEDRAAIIDLIVDFAWRVDHRDGHGVEDLFTADGAYVLFGWPVEGHESIRSFYEQRRSRGTRTSRHLFDNLRITPTESESIAMATSVLTLHAADGAPPLPLAPRMVADYTDIVKKGDDGEWRFERREVTLIFQGEEQR